MSLTLLLVACKKDPVMLPASIQASCRECVVRCVVNGSVSVDTLRWNIVHGDTVSATLKRNYMVEEGVTMTSEACTLDSLPTSTSIVVNGTMQAYAASVYDCAIASEVVHQ